MSQKRASTAKILGIVFGSIAAFLVLSSMIFGLGFFTATAMRSGGGIGDSIYEISMQGVVAPGTSGGLFSSPSITPERIIAQLQAASESPNVKAVLIRMDSPGGVAASSLEIFEEIQRIDKPVVVSVSSVCASGGYYIACAADKIVANRASVIGSIGVILQIPNYEGLYEKLGIKYTTIKQGEYKDVGSADRPITDEEMLLMEEHTRKIYELFIADVAQSRGLDIEKVRELATGWIYLGQEAYELGLIDEVGTYNDAIALAAELGGIKGRPNIIRARDISWMDILSSSISMLFDANRLPFGFDHGVPIYQ
jgi:protease IV